MNRATKKMLAVACAITAGLSIGPIAYSAPTDGSQTVAQIELELTNLAAKSSQAQATLAQARADEITANAKMIAALDEAINSQQKYDDAMAQVNAAKQDLGGIAQAMYQDAAGSLTNAYYLFGAEDLNEATARSHAFEQLAGSTDAKIGRLQALETVAKSLKQKAEKAAQVQADEANAAEAATAEVAKYAADVTAQLNSAKERREELVVQLASLRNTDVEAERARAQQMEATRAQQADTHTAAVVAKAETAAIKIANAKIGETPVEPAKSVTPAVAQKDAAAEKRAEEARKAEAAQKAEAAAREAEAARQAEANRKAEAERQAEAARREQEAREAAAQQQKAEAAASAGNSAIGNQIVAFATQYVGRPYVWGGTSPDTGWDCSGFTGFVFRHFGVNLPRSSSAQYEAYKHLEVPASQARPGDLMWWPGHVGIYVGNGMNVAANTPALGTTVSANYGSPKYLRILG